MVIPLRLGRGAQTSNVQSIIFKLARRRLASVFINKTSTVHIQTGALTHDRRCRFVCQCRTESFCCPSERYLLVQSPRIWDICAKKVHIRALILPANWCATELKVHRRVLALDVYIRANSIEMQSLCVHFNNKYVYVYSVYARL